MRRPKALDSHSTDVFVMSNGTERFEGRTAVVTGSTRGIGESVARRLAAEGANVVVTGLEKTEGAAVAEQIQSEGGTATAIPADLQSVEEIRRLVDSAVDTFGQIDIVVNNAAMQSDHTVRDATIEHWEQVVATNFRAPWLLVREALEHISGGWVINVSSNHAHHTMPGEFPYNSTKAGLEGMTHAMALDLALLDIRANTVTPGWILIDRTRQTLSENELANLEEIHPSGRLGRPEDVAGTVAWLASDDATFINGASILVDGGRGAVMQDDVFAAYRREE
jgi:NAD(P)-dependent dehydrogenase (short-subunit alcohol dehydrogenase family)